MYKCILSLLILSVASLSFTLKSQRYIRDYSTDYHAISEQNVQFNVQLLGWQFIRYEALTTQRTNNMLVFKKPGCKSELYIKVLSNNSGDHQLLAEYLNTSNVFYMLDNQKVNDFLVPRYYWTNVKSQILAFIENKQTRYTPLMAISNQWEKEHCSLLIANLAKVIA